MLIQKIPKIIEKMSFGTRKFLKIRKKNTCKYNKYPKKLGKIRKLKGKILIFF